jgi:hypothetical protein
MKKLAVCLAVVLALGLIFSGCGEGKKTNERDNYLKAMTDVKDIGMSVEAYSVDNYDCPNVATLGELKAKLFPTYIRSLPEKDPWGNPYIYKYVEKEVYMIGCGGSDGKFDGFEQKGTYSTYEGQDIIFSQGEFVLHPL